MKMKLKHLAAVTALACAAAPAFAGIEILGDEAEMWGLVWDEAFGTYAIDFGVTKAQWEAGFTGTLGTVGGANWDAYRAVDLDLNDYERFAGTRWAVVLVSDMFNYAGEPGANIYYTTVQEDREIVIRDLELEQAFNAMSYGFAATLNQSGLTPDNSLDGDTFNPLGTPGHFIEADNSGGGLGIYASNAIGSTHGLTQCTYGGYFDSTAFSTCTPDTMRLINFDGSSFTVAAIPEPGTYALLLGGLAVVGAAARRRRA